MAAGDPAPLAVSTSNGIEVSALRAAGPRLRLSRVEGQR